MANSNDTEKGGAPTPPVPSDAERGDPNAVIGRPTPTQAENDAIRTGAMHIDEKEADGSGPDVARREPGAPYQTRTVKPV